MENSIRQSEMDRLSILDENHDFLKINGSQKLGAIFNDGK